MSGTSKSTCFLLLFFFFLSSIVFAGPEMPEEMKKEFTQYSGSKVLNTINIPVMTQVTLDCGSESMDKIFDYYKKKVTEKGWNVQMENKTAEVYNLILKKDKKGGIITISDEKTKTLVTLSIMIES